ncbi:MAG: aerobic carbon-monoxide dehydrogenase large subunit, partial [Thermoleophilaceae bacterium]|nr:aerobic carbon-monoxide dehydrogenase large subunit [Thermoleophilaceae bacterium]
MSTYVGQAMKRKEDPRLITGRGNYIDDITPMGTLWAAYVRSPEAHARIVSIDVSAARERSDVVAVYTHEDLAGDFAAPMPMIWAPAGVEIKTPEHWPLAKGEVKHVGDPVAVVIGTDRYSVNDAVEDVIVEYDPLPAVVEPLAALEQGSPLVWEAFGTNKTHEWSIAGGDLDAAFAEADRVVKQRVVNHRTAGAAIETRGLVAEPRGEHVTLFTATQIPHICRFVLSLCCGMPEDKLRVVAPDVGGGFGSKLNVFAEEILAVLVAKRLSRPIKWIETRSENMTVTHHGRDQISDVEMAVKSDGKVTGLRVHTIADLGAYFMALTPFIPELGFPVANGCYEIPAVSLTFEGVFTNKFPTDAIRGAGRPEVTHWIEL